MKTTAGILGHRSAVTTLTTYSHLVPEAQREAIERLGATLEAIGGGTKEQ